MVFTITLIRRLCFCNQSVLIPLVCQLIENDVCLGVGYSKTSTSPCDAATSMCKALQVQALKINPVDKNVELSTRFGSRSLSSYEICATGIHQSFVRMNGTKMKCFAPFESIRSPRSGARCLAFVRQERFRAPRTATEPSSCV